MTILFSRSTPRPFHCLAPAMCLLALTSFVDAAPVDLTPPTNSLGYADERGNFRMIHRFGSIPFSNGFELPLRFEFWTGRPAEENTSAFGWNGWRCGPLESTAKFYGGEQFIEIVLLCAKTLYLEQTAENSTIYKDATDVWKGVVEDNTITVSRDDGWQLVFIDSDIDRLRTDDGSIIHWNRDQAGRLVGISEEGEEDEALRITWRDGVKNQVEKLSLPSGDISFQFAVTETNQSLASVAWQTDAKDKKIDFEQTRGEMTVVDVRGVVKVYTWNSESGKLISDGLNTYEYGDETGNSPVVSMTTPSGKTLSHSFADEKGVGFYSDADGKLVKVTRSVDEGPWHGKIMSVSIVAEEKEKILIENTYNDQGALVERSWFGRPVWRNGYSGGRIEAPLFPRSETVYPLSQLNQKHQASSKIEYLYDEKNRHVETRVNGASVLSLQYHRDDLPASLVVHNRFEVQNRDTGDGGRVWKLIIGGVTDEKFGFLGSRDPSIHGNLVVTKRFDQDQNLVEQRYLDGRIVVDQFDERGRKTNTVVKAPDGETSILVTTYVHKPAGNEMLAIIENLQTNQIRYDVVSLNQSGNIISRRTISPAMAETF